MRVRVEQWLDALRTGFWFVPSVMLVLAGALALALLYLDQRIDPGMKASLPWAYSGGPEGARSLLSTIAGSMITAASVTFSLASVALSISSQQYGSRVLRNFMRDRITQFLLGTFVSTFLYSVLVVRSIRGSSFGGGFVPAISVTVAIVLSLASMLLLIFFIHHVSASIQASRIVRVIADNTAEAIDKLYPANTGAPEDDWSKLKELNRYPRVPVSLKRSGYLQTIDIAGLMEIAQEHDLVVELMIKPGDHVVRGSKVGHMWGPQTLTDEVMEDVTDKFLIGGERTPAQDVRYQFQQLTDVIVRALSPGINDPFTAINGIDEITTGATELARRDRVAQMRVDDEGKLRLVLPVATLMEILDETVGHIAVYAAGDRFVMAKLREVLDSVEPELRDAFEHRTLERLRRNLDRRQKAKAPTLPDHDEVEHTEVLR